MDDLLLIFKDAVAAFSSWKVAGALATLAVLAGLLVRLSKTEIGQRLLGLWPLSLLKLDGPARRPWVAAILGAIAGFLGALAAKQPWVAIAAATVSGAFAGWAATGANESRPSSSASRAVLAELKPTNAADVASLKADYESAKAIEAAPARLKAKAELLDRMLR